MGPVHPVGNVVKVNKYREQEREQKQSEETFSQVLAKAQKKTDSQDKAGRPKEDRLRLMGGLFQYNRQAREICYILSNEADYKA